MRGTTRGARHATDSAPRLPRAAVALAALALLLAAAVLITPLRETILAALRDEGASLRAALLAEPVAGVAILFAVILAHAAIPYPAPIAGASAGFVYGFWIGAPIVVVAWLLSALAAYGLARAVGHPIAQRLIGERRLLAAEELVARGGATALVAVRLVPLIPFNATCYASGIARVPLGRYAWTTLVGMMPATLLVVYLGTRLQRPSITDWRLWLAGVGLLALILLGRVTRRRWWS